MDIYHAWRDLKPGVSDVAFGEQVAAYMGHLHDARLIRGLAAKPAQAGTGAARFGEFHPMFEVKDLAQLDAAFQRVAGRQEPTEGFHFGVNSLVRNAVFGLYRDFPDPFRSRGEERF